MAHVLWLPAHPSAGAASMDRFWRELDKQRRAHAGQASEVAIDCPLGSPPSGSRQAGRVVRAAQKYLVYPLLARWAARRPGVEIVHVLDHSFAHLLAHVPRARVRTIVTLHDLAPLREPDGLTAAQLRRFRRTVEHLRAADLVLAVSRYAADEAVALLGVAPGKLRVLPEGVDYALFSSPPAAAPAPWADGLAGGKVVLSVGATAGRKNLRVLPAIFRALRVPGVTLLRVGAYLPAELASELRAILGDDGLVELGPARDDALIRAYQRADALILPSRIEGFGFPVLEAMAAGCPVVCTDVTSLPEVAGDAAFFFGPDDPAAAAEHLGRLLADPSCRARVVAAGRQRAVAFSWAKHYEGLQRIYQAVAAGEVHAAP